MHAIEKGKKNVTYYLISHGSDLTIEDLEHKTAKDYADANDFALLAYLGNVFEKSKEISFFQNLISLCLNRPKTSGIV